MYSEIRGRKAIPTPYPNPEIPGTDHIVAGHHCQDEEALGLSSAETT